MRKRIGSPNPATMSEIVNLTARHVSPKLKHTGINKKNILERGKSWSEPRTRRVLERYAQKHLFSNPVSSRAAFEKFVSSAGEAMRTTRMSKSQSSDFFKRRVIVFVGSVKAKKGITFEKKIVLVRISLEHLKRKFDSFHEMVKKDWGSVKIINDSKRAINEKDVQYYSQNARDAMAHIMGPKLMSYYEVIGELITAAKDLESTFSR